MRHFRAWEIISDNIIGDQGGITCEAIDEPRKSSKTIDKHVIINFRDKNVVIARFRDKNDGFILITYLIIVTDATDGVSVNFFGRCKFLQI